jgi:hypothetical protein
MQRTAPQPVESASSNLWYDRQIAGEVNAGTPLLERERTCGTIRQADGDANLLLSVVHPPSSWPILGRRGNGPSALGAAEIARQELNRSWRMHHLEMSQCRGTARATAPIQRTGVLWGGLTARTLKGMAGTGRQAAVIVPRMTLRGWF